MVIIMLMWDLWCRVSWTVTFQMVNTQTFIWTEDKVGLFQNIKTIEYDKQHSAIRHCYCHSSTYAEKLLSSAVCRGHVQFYKSCKGVSKNFHSVTWIQKAPVSEKTSDVVVQTNRSTAAEMLPFHSKTAWCKLVLSWVNASGQVWFTLSVTVSIKKKLLFCFLYKHLKWCSVQLSLLLIHNRKYHGVLSKEKRRWPRYASFALVA